MNIDKLFSDKEYLEKEFNFFLKKKQIKKINENNELILAFLDKAKHNLEFYQLNKNYVNFNDWLIVTLYYSLYHAALALITKKNFYSKNHYATILILIKEYSFSKDEIKLIEELSISKDDARLYSDLKQDRHYASYSTNIIFTEDKIKYYERGVINFINRVQELVW